MTSEPIHYRAVQKWLHWLIAFIIFGMIPVGFIMGGLPNGALKNTLYELHKSFGIIVFALAALRVGVRLAFGAPPLPAGLPNWQRQAARFSHIAIYVLIVLVPVLGFIGTSMCCAPVNLFWAIHIPPDLPGGMASGERVLGLHKLAVFALAGLLLMHFGAAMWHAVVLRDGVFQRMLPRG